MPAEVLDPPRGVRATLRHLGPGIIISGSIVGSGELIVTTRLGAQVGAALLWLILVSCAVKVFVQIELGRHVVASGQTALSSFATLPGPRLTIGRLRLHWLVCLWAAMGLCSVVQLAGILRGLAAVTALDDLGLSGVPESVWMLGIVAATISLLVVGRYRLVERTTILLVCLFSAITVAGVFLVQASRPEALSEAEIAGGLAFGLPEGSMAATAAFAMLGITGVGASELVYYPYWCLEKGYARHVGPRDDTPEWRRRAAGWIRVMQIDAWCSFMIYTVSTVAFYWLGAAVLHRRGIVPGDDNLHEALSAVYTVSYGADAGPWVYLVGAAAVLFSTFFVATASNSRVFADAFDVFGLVALRDPARRRRMVRALCVVLPLFCLATVGLFERPVLLITIGALAQAALLPFLALASIWLRYRSVPPELAPRSATDVFVWLGFVVLLLVGGYQLWNTVAGG